MNHRTALATGAYAVDLRAAVTADPAAPVRAAVQGAGGYGKTTLLGELAEVYRRAGVPVLDAASAGAATAESAVLVDDAHRLDEPAVRDLVEAARRPGCRVIATYRPWPRTAALGELVGALNGGEPPVLLPPLGRPEIVERARDVFGPAPTKQWLDWLHGQTGGVPRFVGRLLAALDPRDPGEPHTPRAVLEQFQHDLDQFGGGARACLSALAVGAAPHPDLLAALLDLPHETVLAAMGEVRASGFVDANDGLLPIARQAVTVLTPWDQRVRVVRQLAERQLDRGGAVLGLVRPLLGSEVATVPDPTMAAAFEKAGDEASSEAPELADGLYAAAVSAGTPANAVAARRARAAAGAGDLDEALRLADQVLVDETVRDRALGAQVAASALAHRGLLARSAELCRWSVQQQPWSGDRAFATVGLIGTGRLDEADGLPGGQADAGPPTSLSGAVAQLADGVRESVAGSSGHALSTLVRAASLSESVGRAVLLPDSPASIAAVVALHCGELDVAESVLDRALRAGTGGPPLGVRHRLLAAWVPLVRGDTVSARAGLDRATSGRGLSTRDNLVATGLEAGIANRDNDTAALSAVRGAVRKAVAEHSVDLFSLLPLGELAVAAARLHDQDWFAPYLAQARSLLSDLGDPPLWTSLLEWKALQAAVVLEELDTVQRLAERLRALAHDNQLSAAVADAADTWLAVLRGSIDQQQAERSARGLHAAGMTWDGARLAGQAAVRTSDRSAMLALLECARSLQGKPPRPRSVGDEPGSEALSGREQEVVELVLAGLTYKQIGKRLFISAKTVEHHVGRIKQRLGCTSREDLLARLRELVEH